MPRTADSGFDAAVVGKENHTVALIEVKSDSVENWATRLSSQLAGFPERVTFLVAIDPNSIQVYKPTEENVGEPIVRLDTRHVLRHYDPEYASKTIYDFYLLTLAEAWLRDLAYHWKSETPPGSEELRRAGLLEKLEGGTTQRLGA